MGTVLSIERARKGSPDEELSEVVGDLARNWIRWGREQGRALGLSFPQMVLLKTLREADSIPLTRWTDMVGCSPSATTGLIDGMETEGYVRRTHDESDRRQVLVSLTGKGHQAADRMMDAFRTRWATLCEGLSVAQLESATRTLKLVLEKMGDPGGEIPLGEFVLEGAARAKYSPGSPRVHRRTPPRRVARGG
jgi:DNA-binding MarR family transcriptional regulator